MASFSQGRRRIIAALALTSILLLTLDLRGNQVFDGIRSGFSVVVSPFDRAAEVVSAPVVRLWRAYSDYDQIIEENRLLRAQVDAQRSAEIAAQNAIIENQDLLALEGLESLASYDSVTARLIGQSPGNFDQQVEIDRGAIHGIRVGMAALNEAGLVGKVTSVSPQSSVIMLLTDPSYAVPVKILATQEPLITGAVPDEAGETALPEVVRETGVLRGQGDVRLPRVSFIASAGSFGRIEEGDTVFTAGGSTSLAPPNIPVGQVANVITRAGTAGQELEIEPSADLDRLQFLRVVLYLPPSELGG